MQSSLVNDIIIKNPQKKCKMSHYTACLYAVGRENEMHFIEASDGQAKRCSWTNQINKPLNQQLQSLEVSPLRFLQKTEHI